MGKRNKILVLDGCSYVGGHLVACLGAERAVTTYYRTPVESAAYFDALTMDLSQVIQSPEEYSHAVILLAITNMDYCAADVTRSYALNVASVKRVIDFLNQWDIKPVFTSTESVFDGVKGNYDEADPPNPIVTYGRQKVEVEKYIQSCCQHYTVVRLGKVFGSQRDDGTLFTSWLDAIERSEVIRCANDQVFSPIHIEDVVKGITRLIDMDCDGLFHLANPKAYSRLELLDVLRSEVRGFSSVEINVVPCSIHEFGLLEERPLNVSMKPDKYIRTTGMEIRAVEDVVRDIVKDSFSPAAGRHPEIRQRGSTGSPPAVTAEVRGSKEEQ